MKDKRSERQFARDCYSELLTMPLRLLAAKFILLQLRSNIVLLRVHYHRDRDFSCGLASEFVSFGRHVCRPVVLCVEPFANLNVVDDRRASDLRCLGNHTTGWESDSRRLIQPTLPRLWSADASRLEPHIAVDRSMSRQH